MTEAHHARSQIRTAIGLLFCVAGIYGAYLTQGVVQETLSTKRFGPEGRRFTHLPALNGFQSWACFLWAFVLINVFQRGHSEGLPPITAYCRPAISNSIGPALGMQALRYISYPAQVLAKSSKMIPVMLMGTLLHAKSYSALEYACCLLISGEGRFGEGEAKERWWLCGGLGTVGTCLIFGDCEFVASSSSARSTFLPVPIVRLPSVAPKPCSNLTPPQPTSLLARWHFSVCHALLQQGHEQARAAQRPPRLLPLLCQPHA